MADLKEVRNNKEELNPQLCEYLEANIPKYIVVDKEKNEIRPLTELEKTVAIYFLIGKLLRFNQNYFILDEESINISSINQENNSVICYQVSNIIMKAIQKYTKINIASIEINDSGNHSYCVYMYQGKDGIVHRVKADLAHFDNKNINVTDLSAIKLGLKITGLRDYDHKENQELEDAIKSVARELKIKQRDLDYLKNLLGNRDLNHKQIMLSIRFINRIMNNTKAYLYPEEYDDALAILLKKLFPQTDELGNSKYRLYNSIEIENKKDKSLNRYMFTLSIPEIDYDTKNNVYKRNGKYHYFAEILDGPHKNPKGFVEISEEEYRKISQICFIDSEKLPILKKK